MGRPRLKPKKPTLAELPTYTVFSHFVDAYVDGAYANPKSRRGLKVVVSDGTVVSIQRGKGHVILFQGSTRVSKPQIEKLRSAGIRVLDENKEAA